MDGISFVSLLSVALTSRSTAAGFSRFFPLGAGPSAQDLTEPRKDPEFYLLSFLILTSCLVC